MYFEKEYLKCSVKSPYLKGAFLIYKLRYKLLINSVADHIPQGYAFAFYVYIYIHVYECSSRSMVSDMVLNRGIIHGHLPASVCS